MWVIDVGAVVILALAIIYGAADVAEAAARSSDSS
jgi:hypothetical protein